VHILLETFKPRQLGSLLLSYGTAYQILNANSRHRQLSVKQKHSNGLITYDGLLVVKRSV